MDKSILIKIQKLSAKAESAHELGNIAEAAAFSAKVSEMLTIHNLAMADLEVEEQSDVIGEKNDDLGVSKSMGRWTVSLLTTLCEFNFCHSIYHTSTKGYRYNRRGRRIAIKDKNMSVTLVGRPENVEVVKYLYSVLKLQFENMSAKAWKVYLKELRSAGFLKHYSKDSIEYKKPWNSFRGVSNRQKYITSFLLGAVLGVHQKLTEQQVAAEKTHGNKITDLVIVNDAAVQSWVDDKFPKLGSMINRSRKIDGDAYGKGQSAGRNASMAKGVSSGATVSTKFIN